MSERVTHAMLTNAMEYLAELLGVNYVPQSGVTIAPKPGDITYEDHDMRNARYYFAIYRYETVRYDNPYNDDGGCAVIRSKRKLTTHRPYGLQSHNARELHDHVRFACELLRASRGIIERAKEMGEL